MASTAAPSPTLRATNPEGRRLWQRLERTGEQRNLKQGCVIETGLDAAANKAEHTFCVVKTDHGQ